MVSLTEDRRGTGEVVKGRWRVRWGRDEVDGRRARKVYDMGWHEVRIDMVFLLWKRSWNSSDQPNGPSLTPETQEKSREPRAVIPRFRRIKRVFYFITFLCPLSPPHLVMINETDPNYFPHLQYSARDLPVRHYLPRPSFV